MEAAWLIAHPVLLRGDAMSCPEYELSPSGRRGVGVVQPQSGIDYPFVGFVPRQPPYDNDFRQLVADFYLAYDDDGEYDPTSEKTVPPFRMQYMYGIGCVENTIPADFFTPTHEADLMIVDANDKVVFNTAAADMFDVKMWGDDYKIYTWTTYKTVCCLVVYTTWPNGDDAAQNYAKYLKPEQAILDARTVYKMPKRLLSLGVRQKNGTVIYGPFIGALALKNGYNTTIIEAEKTNVSSHSFVANTNIRISGVAGSGAGYYPVCGSGYDETTHELLPQPIKRINGVGPTTGGNFLLSSSDCLYARRPTAVVDAVYTPSRTAGQQIGADCPPCCRCSDYVDTALYMNQLSERYQLIGTRVTEAKLIHEQNIAKWSDRRQCTLAQPLKLLFVAQRCPTLDCVLMICNSCATCIPGSTLNLQLSTALSGVTAELVCGYTALFTPDVRGHAIPITTNLTDPTNLNIAVKMPPVNAGSSAYIKFRLKFSQRASYAITGTLTGTLDQPYNIPIKTGCDNETPEEERLTATVTATTALYCGTSGETNMPC